MRVFPDTNVLLAALATRGLCADLLRTLLADHEVVVGEPVLAELRRNLVAKLRVPAGRVEQTISFLKELERALPAGKAAAPPPGIDRADSAILECAVHATVEIFVTGDRALLDLGAYGGIPIVSPRALWSRLRHPDKN